MQRFGNRVRPRYAQILAGVHRFELSAQKLARTKYYTEYHVQVCTLDRESKFKAKDTAATHA
jgi:hypothetical protein